MPRKITHPFQLELLRKQKDKAQIERELKLRQRIYTFAELSEKERKRRFAFLIAEKQFAAQRSESSDDSELDSDCNPDVEINNETSFPNLKDNSSKPFVRNLWGTCSYGIPDAEECMAKYVVLSLWSAIGFRISHFLVLLFL